MDQFGADPQVRAMRLVFSRMEEYDLAAARQMGLDWTDPRLRELRRRALAGHQAQLSRLAATRPLDGESFVEAYQASFDQAARQMGLAAGRG